MKKLIKISFAISALIIILAGCVKENYDITPKRVFSVDFDANTTIAELKELYPLSVIIEDDIIIKGTVISDDSFNNFYEELVIQDSTGGIEIQIDKSELYKGFPVGRMVYVKCKGLIISDYRGVRQLTYLSNGSSEKLPEGVIDDYLFRSEEGIPIAPKILRISELSEEHINTLVKIENVEFIESDLETTFANPHDDANRTITDLGENTMIVRTSEYADFANDTVPSGNGSIIGVYGVYDSDKQLYIRDLAELDMTNDRLIRNYLLDEGFYSDLGSFTGYNVTGTQIWEHDTYDNGCAKMSGYSGSAHTNEDWLIISSAIDLSSVSDALLSFTHAVGYFDSWDDGTVQISGDYDGLSDPSVNGTWVEVTDFIKATNWDFVSSGGIYLSDFVGNSSVYIAFKYTSSTTAAMTWEIGSVKVITN